MAAPGTPGLCLEGQRGTWSRGWGGGANTCLRSANLLPYDWAGREQGPPSVQGDPDTDQTSFPPLWLLSPSCDTDSFCRGLQGAGRLRPRCTCDALTHSFFRSKNSRREPATASEPPLQPLPTGARAAAGEPGPSPNKHAGGREGPRGGAHLSRACTLDRGVALNWGSRGCG